jgi:hypothetical protein
MDRHTRINRQAVSRSHKPLFIKKKKGKKARYRAELTRVSRGPSASSKCDSGQSLRVHFH